MGQKQKRFNAHTVKCNCCEKRRTADGLRKLHLWLTDNFRYYGNDVLEFARNGREMWACDACIKKGKAIAANASRQNSFGYYLPFQAYWDRTLNCATCKEDFVFGRHEQQFWYEDLQFYVFSVAKNCKKCRKSMREEKADETELGKLLSNLDVANKTEIEAVIRIFMRRENVDKAKFYLSFIPKIAGFRTNTALVAKHAELKEQIQNIALN